MSFDLDQFDVVTRAEEGAKCVLKDPLTGEDTPAYLILAGMDSSIYKQAQHKIANARINRKSTARITIEEIEAEQVGVLVECTLGWGGMVLKGVEVPFDRKSVKMIYEKFPTVLEQAQQFVSDRGNYLRD
jgi:glutamine amidotransferase-like uncharacterized protein